MVSGTLFRGEVRGDGRRLLGFGLVMLFGRCDSGFGFGFRGEVVEHCLLSHGVRGSLVMTSQHCHGYGPILIEWSCTNVLGFGRGTEEGVWFGVGQAAEVD